jgi:hypothetical protein
MNDCIHRCQCRAALTARAAQADFYDTLLVGTMMAAALAGAAWLMMRLAV